MTAEEFVKEFYLLKTELTDSAFDANSGTKVSTMIVGLNLDSKTRFQLQNVISTLLTDAFYTILLGLDGEAQIGIRQELYKIYDESGNELTGGEIEAHTWEYFHNNEDNK